MDDPASRMVLDTVEQLHAENASLRRMIETATGADQLWQSEIVELRRRLEVAEAAKSLDELEPELRAKIKLLGAIPHYVGVWRPGSFPEGAMVTRDGGIFIARETTTDKPGDGVNAWTLAVKPGRNAASVYELAKRAGVTCSERDFNKALAAIGGKQ